MKVTSEDIEQVEHMSVGDTVSSLAHARLRLALARRLLQEVIDHHWVSKKWADQAKAWLAVKD